VSWDDDDRPKPPTAEQVRDTHLLTAARNAARSAIDSQVVLAKARERDATARREAAAAAAHLADVESRAASQLDALVELCGLAHVRLDGVSSTWIAKQLDVPLGRSQSGPDDRAEAAGRLITMLPQRASRLAAVAEAVTTDG
jgi:hypothetical protein